MMPALWMTTFKDGLIDLNLIGKTFDRQAVLNVQNCGLHTGIGSCCLVEQLFATASDDNLVAFDVKRLCERTPYA